MDYLVCSKTEQIISGEIIKDSLKLIHKILKFNDFKEKISAENQEKILDIVNIYHESLVNEKAFFNILYIIYFLTEENEDGFFIKILNKEKLLQSIIDYKIDPINYQNIVFMLIFKNLMKTECELIEVREH